MDLKFGEHAGDADGTQPDGEADTQETVTLKEAEMTAAKGLLAMEAKAGGEPQRITMEDEHAVFARQADSPPCPECGSVTVRNGACYKCNNCGATTGCS